MKIFGYVAAGQTDQIQTDPEQKREQPSAGYESKKTKMDLMHRARYRKHDKGIHRKMRFWGYGPKQNYGMIKEIIRVFFKTAVEMIPLYRCKKLAVFYGKSLFG